MNVQSLFQKNGSVKNLSFKLFLWMVNGVFDEKIKKASTFLC